MERIKSFGYWLFDELTFWSEVLVEAIGLDRGKYADYIEMRQREIENERALERKKELYQRLSV